MPTLNYTTTVRLERSNARTVENKGRTAVTGSFLTGEDETGNQSFVRVRIDFDRSNARNVRSA